MTVGLKVLESRNRDGGRRMKPDNKKKKELVLAALKARETAYAPYSGYAVGAALLTKTGKVYTGCNIENASFGATNCAERTAFFKAVSEGEKAFTAIAIAGAKAGEEVSDYAYPCGLCRQVMQEFCDADFLILIGTVNGEYKEHTLAELLPYGFGGDNLT